MAVEGAEQWVGADTRCPATNGHGRCFADRGHLGDHLWLREALAIVRAGAPTEKEHTDD